ncbi:MAG: MBL fold metallo-hydrolase [Spirochaetia bacterium]|nr:MBL fold metallo-hydrolase [Spirochaetia bacterium]
MLNQELSIEFLGAAGTVTGSKYLVRSPDATVLIDCGMFQGLKKLRLLNWEAPHLNVGMLDAVLLTHGHLDHVGYLPRLVKAGFRGRILGSRPTLDIAEIILKDSAHIQEEEAERANRYGYSKHNPAAPLYDSDDVERTVRLFGNLELDKSESLSPNVTCRLRYNGHILGATFIELDVAGKLLVFSGDIGRKVDPLLRPPERPERADVLVIESTYGDRLHDNVDAASRLAEIISRTAKRNGTVIIPSFAVERTQSIMYYLWKLQAEKRIPGIPVYMDSPMGNRVLDLFHRYIPWHKLSPQDCTKMCDKIHRVASMKETMAIADDRRAKIVIAGSGMITGGRVLTYLQKHLGDPNSTVVLVGYQATGTRGRDLLEGKKSLKIYGKVYDVGAEIENIDGLSAHADQAELIDWLGNLKQPPGRIFIVHGEPEAALGLQKEIQNKFGWKSEIPEMYQTFRMDLT